MKALLLLLVGCASYGTLTTARPVAPGASQVTTALEIDGIGVVENPARVPLPSLSVDVRRGLARDLDAGAKLSILPLGGTLTAIGGEGQLRWRALGSDTSRVELAIAPAGGWRSVASSMARWDAAHAVVPVIVGVTLGRHQLYAKVEAGWQRWWSAGSMPVDVPFAGSGVGFAWRVGRRTTLVPELSVLHTPTTVDQSSGAVIVNVGVGLMFDGK